MRRRFILTIAATCLSGCTVAMADGPTPAGRPGAACDATRVQGHVGEPASAQLGTEVLRASGAKTLRWLPPGVAVTMDYRDDRLDIAYDERLTIMRISCG